MRWGVWETVNPSTKYTKMKGSIIIVVGSIKDFNAFLMLFILDVNRLPSLQHQTVSSDPLPDIMDLFDDGLEVGSGIVRTGDENVVGLARGCRGVQRRDRNEPGRFETGWVYALSTTLNDTYLSKRGPRSLRPGSISACGFLVSTIVLTIATYTSLAQTLWVDETMAT